MDLQVSAGTRIFLRPLVPTFPCFSSIAMSLMEKVGVLQNLRLTCQYLHKLGVTRNKLGNNTFIVARVQPQIDFGLRVMGADIMAVPGLYQIVQVRHLVIRMPIGAFYLSTSFNFPQGMSL